jgi:uncharacterized membrane protein YtjA (UPF0391 family)
MAIAERKMQERLDVRASALRSNVSQTSWHRRSIMFSWALTFFILAIIAAILGFTGVAGTLAWAAKMLFVAGLILAIVFFVIGRRPPSL